MLTEVEFVVLCLIDFNTPKLFLSLIEKFFHFFLDDFRSA